MKWIIPRLAQAFVFKMELYEMYKNRRNDFLMCMCIIKSEILRREIIEGHTDPQHPSSTSSSWFLDFDTSLIVVPRSVLPEESFPALRSFVFLFYYTSLWLRYFRLFLPFFFNPGYLKDKYIKPLRGAVKKITKNGGFGFFFLICKVY